MKQKTNENKLISSGYQELNPEMDAFLVYDSIKIVQSKDAMYT